MKPREQTTAQLAKALRAMADSVERRDSFEGSISYEATDKRDWFEVQAFWRVGNSKGQGGSIMIGEDET